MKRNTLVVAVVVVVLVVGGLLLFSKKATAPKTETTVLTPSKDAVSNSSNTSSNKLATDNAVTYQNGAFSPNPITVKKGTAVMFVSQSGNFWVASDPHPTHTDYPGFDELSSGTSYNFTFDKVGNWGYHNHLDHSQTGRVIVTE